MKANDVSVILLHIQTDETTLTSVKSDTSLLFKRLNELNSAHRILMTGVRSDLSVILYSAETLIRHP